MSIHSINIVEYATSTDQDQPEHPPSDLCICLLVAYIMYRQYDTIRYHTVQFNSIQSIPDPVLQLSD